MRTRHWKQLVRVSGSTALVDNETLKMLTFGQLLELNIHGKYNKKTTKKQSNSNIPIFKLILMKSNKSFKKRLKI